MEFLFKLYWISVLIYSAFSMVILAIKSRAKEGLKDRWRALSGWLLTAALVPLTLLALFVTVVFLFIYNEFEGIA